MGSKPVSASVLFDIVVRQLDGQGDSGLNYASPNDFASVPQAPDLAGLKILLAEDNETNREIVSELLGDTGAQITLAHDGKQALERIGEAAFDVVLMDVHMPVMDGVAATRALRRDPRYKDIPIIAMTANVMAGDRQRFLEAGMNDHIGKPIDIANFYAMLAKLAGRELSPVPTPTDTRVVGATPSAQVNLRVSGLNLRAGLANFAGKSDRYLATLRRFCRGWPEMESRFRVALGEPDPLPLEREAHTLKGLSATIGATSLADLASGLEERARAGDEVLALEQDVVSLIREAALLVSSIASQLPDEVESPENVGGTDGVPEIEPSRAIDHLAKVLADDDAEAVDLSKKYRGALKEQLGDKIARAVINHTDRFEFDEALKLLGSADPQQEGDAASIPDEQQAE